MTLTAKIDNAKSCVAKFAESYVKAVTFGIDTNDLFYELLLLVSYIEALERYDEHPTQKIKVENVLTYNDVLLVDNNLLLSLGSTCKTVCLNPDDVNCLSKREVCFMLEQISLKCEACICGC